MYESTRRKRAIIKSVRSRLSNVQLLLVPQNQQPYTPVAVLHVAIMALQVACAGLYES